MGNCKSKDMESDPNGPIDPNHITIALNPNGVLENDYLDAVDFDQIYKLIQAGNLPLETGFVRTANGGLYIASLTDLGDEVTGEMFEWWFNQVDNTEKYKWWHPYDHVHGTWDQTYFSVQTELRPKGHYIGHTHIVTEKIGKKVQRLQIYFMKPDRFVDVSKFEENGVTACLIGRISVHDPPFGFVAVGYLMHLVRKTADGRNELRSRFWLGDIHKDEEGFKFITSRVINTLGNTSFFRNIRLPDNLARGLLLHCSQEMNCLKEFLPHYYHSKINSNDK
eukprot:gene20641-26762_t